MNASQSVAMRIALITETYPPQINGVSRTLGRLTSHLASKGHELLVIHQEYRNYQYASSPDLAEISEHIRVLNMPSMALPFYQEVVLPRPPFTKYKQALIEFRPDLVHIATEGGLGLSALRFCRKQSWPVVSSFHTNFDAYARHYRMSWMVPIVARYLKWFHNNTLATYVPSPSIINRLQELGFKRLHLWPRGVDTSLFQPDRSGAKAVREQFLIPLDAIVVGHCGRLAAEKNIDYLGDALAIVLEQNPEIHCLIVGDGPARASLETRLDSIPQATSRIHFTGYLTGHLLADAYSAMNLFAFSSRTETFGNVLLEAMASGLPVVALADGGPSDVVQDGQTGTLLPPEAPAVEMANVINHWSADQDLRSRLASGASIYAKSQTWERIMDQLIRDYETVLEHNQL